MTELKFLCFYIYIWTTQFLDSDGNRVRCMSRSAPEISQQFYKYFYTYCDKRTLQVPVIYLTDTKSSIPRMIYQSVLSYTVPLLKKPLQDNTLNKI